MTGFIYAIECSGRIKLGFSKDPEKRFNKVASDAPFPCQLLGYWPGSRADEIDVQDKFRAGRVHGEWFAATEELLSFIADVNERTVRTRGKTNLCGFRIPRGDKVRLADFLGLHSTTLCRWQKVPAEHVRKVAQFTGISPSILRPDLYRGMEPAADWPEKMEAAE